MSSLRKEISRRQFLQGSVLAGGLFALPHLAAFPAAFARQDTVSIEYWHAWTGQWSDYVNDVIAAFQAKQSAVTVNPVIVPYGDMIPRMTAGVAAGTAPDVVTLFESAPIASMGALGVLTPFSQIASPEEIEAIKTYFSAPALAGGTYKGELYGLVSIMATTLLGWNKQIVAAAELDPDSPPTTMGELEEWFEILTIVDSSGEIKQLGFPTFIGGGNGALVWFANFGGKIYDPDTDTITANDPNNVRALEWMQSYSEKYGVEQLTRFNASLADGAKTQDPFISGQLAMSMIGPWQLGDFKRYAAEDFSVNMMELPPIAGEEDTTGRGNYMWGNYQIIPAATSHPKEAFEFVKWWSGFTDQSIMATIAAWNNTPVAISGSPQAATVPEIQAVIAENPLFQKFFDSLTSTEIITQPMLPVGSFFMDRLGAEVDKALNLEQSAQEALDIVQQTVQQEYDTWKAQNPS